jgi:hypothetical protein
MPVLRCTILASSVLVRAQDSHAKKPGPAHARASGWCVIILLAGAGLARGQVATWQFEQDLNGFAQSGGTNSTVHFVVQADIYNRRLRHAVVFGRVRDRSA